MKDFKMPVAVITFLAAQAGGMVWFLSGMEGRVKTLEGKRLGDVEMIAKENRRYIREVIQPSYNISDAWANPHFDAWLKQGGWADAPACPFAKQEMKVAVVGAGTAGLYCIIELLESLPEFAKIDLIHSNTIDPLGVGESSLKIFGFGKAFDKKI